MRVLKSDQCNGGVGEEEQLYKSGGRGVKARILFTSQYCLGIVVQVHYRLRPIKRRQQEFRSFVSHFIHNQIFQMKILSLSLILIAPKYSRQICRGQKKHILISFLISLQNVRKKVRVELCQIFHPGAQIFAKSNFTFKLKFHLETVLLSNAFLGMVYIFTLQKIFAQRGRVHPFLHLLLFWSNFLQ